MGGNESGTQIWWIRNIQKQKMMPSVDSKLDVVIPTSTPLLAPPFATLCPPFPIFDVM